jgi:hypothetical protein
VALAGAAIENGAGLHGVPLRDGAEERVKNCDVGSFFIRGLHRAALPPSQLAPELARSRRAAALVLSEWCVHHDGCSSVWQEARR